MKRGRAKAQVAWQLPGFLARCSLCRSLGLQVSSGGPSMYHMRSSYGGWRSVSRMYSEDTIGDKVGMELTDTVLWR